MKPLQVGATRGPLLTPLHGHQLVFVVVVLLDLGERAAKHSHCEHAAVRSV